MPRCQYRVQSKDVELNATFPSPRKITELDAWLVSAVKALKSLVVPVVVDRGRAIPVKGWTETNRDVTPRWITFEFVDADGNKSKLIIDRQFQEYAR